MLTESLNPFRLDIFTTVGNQANAATIAFLSAIHQLPYLWGWSYREYEAPMSESTSTIEFERFDPRKPPDCFSSFTQWQTNPTLHHHQNSQYISRSPQQAGHSLTSTWMIRQNNTEEDWHSLSLRQKKNDGFVVSNGFICITAELSWDTKTLQNEGKSIGSEEGKAVEEPHAIPSETLC